MVRCDLSWCADLLGLVFVDGGYLLVVLLLRFVCLLLFAKCRVLSFVSFVGCWLLCVVCCL